MASLLETLASASKLISAAPPWSEPIAPDRSISITIPLDIAGATEEGLFLLGRAVINRPTENVSFTLAYQPGENKRKRVLLGRIDWRPSGSHVNRFGPAEFVGVHILGTHVHSFSANWLPAEERPRKHLPVALPITVDFGTFAHLRDAVGSEFIIGNPEQIPEPNWSQELF